MLVVFKIVAYAGVSFFIVYWLARWGLLTVLLEALSAVLEFLTGGDA